MAEIQIRSTGSPFDHVDLAARAVTALRQADAMGLLPANITIRKLDADSFRKATQRLPLPRRNILEEIARALDANDPDQRTRLAGFLEKLNEILRTTPVPDHEWAKVLLVLDSELLSRLVGVSESSLRRYKSRSRETPDEIADRLHFVATLVGYLTGAYNEMGVRRWFERKRARLQDRSPADVLSGQWKPGDVEPEKVRELAQSLASSPAT
jgi:uncharacterized protein (DUF2384 family)